MKILMINHFPLAGSGSGVSTINVAKSLVKAGHEVCIIVPENEPIEKSIANIKVHPVYFNSKELPFNFPCFTTHPRSEQTFYDLSCEQYIAYKHAFKHAIEEEIKNFQPDIIHSGHIWTLSAIAAQYDIPLVITAHGTDLLGLQKRDERYNKDAEEAYKKASAIIAISPDNAKLVKDIFPYDSDKIHLIPNGYNDDIFKIKGCKKEEVLRKHGVTRSYNTIISFAGKFTEIKGIDVLIKACKIYEKEDTLTLLAGDGELMTAMRLLANKLDIKNIVFLGNLSPNDLQEIFEIADVSIVPSRSEAFGLVAVEALACGTPVVASRIGGLTSIINDDVGAIFEPENYKDLAAKIVKTLKRTDLNPKAIADYARTNYSQDKFTEQLCEIYRESVLGENKSMVLCYCD